MHSINNLKNKIQILPKKNSNKELKREIKRLSKIEPETSDLNNSKKELKREIKNDDTLYMKSEMIKSSENKKFMDYHITPNIETPNVEIFLKYCLPVLNKNIENYLKTFNTDTLKFSLTIGLQYYKIDPNTGEDIVTDIYHYSSKNGIVLNKSEIPKKIEEASENILSQIENNNNSEGSGFGIYKINYLKLHLNKYTPLKGSSYIDLSKFIKDKKACINVKNNDNKCFKWALLSALYPPKKHSDRMSNYNKYWNDIKDDGIEYPMKINKIENIEKRHPELSITVFGYEKNKFHHLYKSKNNQGKEKIIDLLLISDNNNSHYVWIKDLSRLLSNELNQKKVKKYICRNCLQFKYSEEDLNKHKYYCLQTNIEGTPIWPSDDTPPIEFHHFNYKFSHPFVGYLDFEVILQKYNIIERDQNQNNSFTDKISQHIPSSFGFKLKSPYINLPFKLYRGENPAKKLMNYLINVLAKEIKNIQTKELHMSADDEFRFKNQKICHICEKYFKKDDRKVRDHCHYSGKFLGAAHNKCNLKRKEIKEIPILIHNGSKYDVHLIVKELAKVYRDQDIQCIAQTEECYIMLNKKLNGIKFKFIDMYRFMPYSLDKLISYLGDKSLSDPILKTLYSGDLKDLERKGVFPYEYVDDWNKYNETEFPSKENFYSNLNNSNINNSDYEYGKQIFNNLKDKNLGNYNDLYLIVDVLQMMNVFENFRNVCINTYKLDPPYYLTAPGLFWDAMLKKTKIKLELIKDPEIHMMIKNGIRGGIVQSVTRYGQSNKDNHLLYLDANNLYGWAMNQYLPYKNIEKSSEEKWRNNTDPNIGFILEVDLIVPKELHDKFNDFPLAPEHRNKKLCCTLEDKTRYISHENNLKFYLKQGLELAKIHNVIQFQQKPFLKEYIDFNTEKRKNSKNDFEKEFFKLANNAVFGKTMENVDKRRDIRLRSEEQAENLVKQPNFCHRTIFDKNLIACHMKKLEVKRNKPIYVGFTILELSKLLMYDFHYNKIGHIDKKLYYGDTDSLIYALKDDPYGENGIIKNNIDLFDTSDLPIDHPCYSLKNKKVVGKFKDELKGIKIKEFVALRSKNYCYITEENEKVIKNKGIKKTIYNQLNINMYKNSLFKDEIYHKEFQIFKSYKHELNTINMNKKVLDSNDDKRFICKDKINTLAWGHTKIQLPTN